MAEIVFVRHGQASFGADDYDALSPLGIQQSIFLGEHMRRLSYPVDRIISGTMKRHIQTASGLIDGLGRMIDVEQHSGLDEYDFQGLLTPLNRDYPSHWHSTGQNKKDYFYNIKSALSLWMQGKIQTDGTDSWESFRDRVVSALAFACQGPAKRTVVVSSGGVIAAILGHILKHRDEITRDISLQIKNSSCSKLLFNGDSFALDSFNDVSHLLVANHELAITLS